MNRAELAGFATGVGLGLLALAALYKLAVRPALLAQIRPEVRAQLAALPPAQLALVQAVGLPVVADAVGEAVRVILSRELP